MFYKRHKWDPMFTSIMLLGTIIGGLTSCVWTVILVFLFPNTPGRSWLVAILVALLLYYRYYNKAESLQRKFKHSKLNKIIPDWIMIWGSYLFSVVVGIAMIFVVRDYVLPSLGIELFT